MALFEITAPVELLEPTRCAACSSSAWSAATDASSSGPASFRLTSCTRPESAAVAVPEEALDPDEQRRRDPAQPLFRPQLEDPVRLQPRLLGAAPAAGLRRRREPVERRGDDVEVGAGGRLLPGVRVEAVDQLEGAVGARAYRLRRRRAARTGGVERSAEAVDDRRQLAGRSRVAGEQLGRDVRERDRHAVAEADRLLDLECQRDAGSLDAAVVLDRHEPQEAVELSRAARLLRRLRAVRRGSLRAVARSRRPNARPPPDGPRAACSSPVKRLLELGERCVAALAAVARLEDRRVAAGERRFLGQASGEAAAGGRDGVVEGGAQLCLVGVEQIGPDRPCGDAWLRCAASERRPPRGWRPFPRG